MSVLGQVSELGVLPTEAAVGVGRMATRGKTNAIRALADVVGHTLGSASVPADDPPVGLNAGEEEALEGEEGGGEGEENSDDDPEFNKATTTTT